MAQNISARRGAAIAGFATLVLLALLAAFDNQWLAKWRAGQSSAGGNAAHSWFAGPIRGLSALAWRATKETGEPTRIFFGVIAEPVIAVVLTFLFLLLVCRGVGAERGRWSLFLGAWFVTGLAASAGLIVGSAIAGTDGSGAVRFGRGEIYYTLITLGLAFGLFAGWLVGFVAVLVYGSTEIPEDERATREYEAPSYADYASSAISSSAPSSGSGSSDDYSFNPTSPYASGSSGGPAGHGGYGSSYSGRGDYESPEAPTEIGTPPQENDPYGGARPY